jgi:hypothetical protein
MNSKASAPAKKALAKPKAAAPAAAKPKAPARKAAPKAAKSASSHEAMLARVESVRLAQRNEGHFDCFGRASQGYCDQGGCAYHVECLSVSRLLHEV